jgi:hypothetical protein
MSRSIPWRSCLTAVVAAQILAAAAWSQDFRGGYPGAEQASDAGQSGPALINGGAQLQTVPRGEGVQTESLTRELLRVYEQIAQLQEEIQELRTDIRESGRAVEVTEIRALVDSFEALVKRLEKVHGTGMTISPPDPVASAQPGRLVLNNLTGVTQPVLVDGVWYYVVPGRMVLLRNRGPITVHAPSEVPKQYQPENWRVTERGWELEVRIAYPPVVSPLWRSANFGLLSVSR